MSTSARFAEGPGGSPKRGTGSGPMGPAYSPIMAAVLPNAPKFTFARAARDGRTASSLGSSTGTASRSPSRSASPGPGAYRTEEIDGIGHKQASSTHAAAPRAVFGSARRPEVAVADTPGPGLYQSSIETTRPRSARVLFGISGRFTGGAAGSVGSNIPGPSAYDAAAKLRLLKAAPSIKFATAPRDGGHRTHAGAASATASAAAYDVEAAMRATRTTSPRPKIGTASRFGTGSKAVRCGWQWHHLSLQLHSSASPMPPLSTSVPTRVCCRHQLPRPAPATMAYPRRRRCVHHQPTA